MSVRNSICAHLHPWFPSAGPVTAVFWQEINTGGKICSNHLYIYHHNQQSKPRPGSLFVGLN